MRSQIPLAGPKVLLRIDRAKPAPYGAGKTLIPLQQKLKVENEVSLRGDFDGFSGNLYLTPRSGTKLLPFTFHPAPCKEAHGDGFAAAAQPALRNRPLVRLLTCN